MRHLATIREIASLRPIEGADRIEVAQVDGWECVVQKGEFHVGEHMLNVNRPHDAKTMEGKEWESCDR